MELKQKAIKSTIWSVVQAWGTQAMSFIVFSLLARLLNPESFGLIALASIFLGFINLFLDQGFSKAIIQRRELEREHLDTAFWTNVGIAFVMTAITIAGAGLIAEFFSQPKLIPVLRWLSLSFLIGSLNSVQAALLQRNLDFKPLAIRSLIATLGGGVVGLTLALMGFGVWSLVFQQLANSVIQVITLWWASDWRPRLSFSMKHLRDLFSFGINILAINILNFLITNGDNFLIGYFLGPIALGYYSLAYRLLTVVSQLFIGAISSTAMPIFSRIQDDIPKLRSLLYDIVEMSNAVAFPIFLGMSVLAPELIVVIFGKQWVNSIPVMQVLNIIGILYSGFYFNGPLIMAIGKPNWKLGLDVIRTFFYLLAFFIAVKWGIVAVAASYVVTAYIIALATVWVMKKLIKIDIKLYLSKYFVPLIASLIMILSISGVKYLIRSIFVVNEAVLLVSGIVVGFIFYPLSIRLIKPDLFQKFLGIINSALLKVKNV
jgi:PST family polysaccharide transporter